MGIPGLIVSFALGAAALALWIDLRFPKLAPETFRLGIAHICTAVLLGQLAMLPAQTLAVDMSGILIALFALAVPTLVYSFLTALWLFRICQRMLGGAIR